MRSRRVLGFTLIELLVSVGLVSVISATVAVVVFLLLRSFSKTQSTKELKEVGESALIFIEKTVRDGVSLEGCSSGTLSVKNSDGDIATFSCDSADKKIVVSYSPSGKRLNLTPESVECSNFSCSSSPYGNGFLLDISFDLKPAGSYFPAKENNFSSKMFFYQQR